MISINKTYIPSNEQQIVIDFFCDDISGTGFGQITSIELYKKTSGTEYKYTVSQSLSSTESYFNSSVDYGSLQLIILDSSITKTNETDPDFTFDGVIRIKAILSDDENPIEGLVYNRYEFYDYKSKIVSLNEDFTNISKLSKAINTVTFLERMLDYCIDKAQEEEANRYYRELVKVSNFWYSNIIQNNPNSIY